MPRSKLMRVKQKQEITRNTNGKCPYCKKEVASLKDHLHDKHLGKKAIKK